MSKILHNTYPVEAHQEVLNALTKLSAAIAKLEEDLYEACYDKAFAEGVEWFKNEIGKVSDPLINTLPEPPKIELPELDRFIDQTIYSYISSNQGWRTSDIITRALEIPVKPSLTEARIKVSINRLKKDGKIDSKAGRWYSTEQKNSGQKYQVMAYLPDGSKYLGTDIIKEEVN